MCNGFIVANPILNIDFKPNGSDIIMINLVGLVIDNICCLVSNLQNPCYEKCSKNTVHEETRPGYFRPCAVDPLAIWDIKFFITTVGVLSPHWHPSPLTCFGVDDEVRC